MLDHHEPAIVPPPYEHVVATVASSSFYEIVVEGSRVLADATEAQLHLVHVCSAANPAEQRTRASLERRLSMLVPGCTPEWLEGDSVHAGPAIARYVQSLGGGAIGGVSCHGYRGFDLLLGSVTEDLLARSRRLVVFGPAGLPAKPQRVAVCLDGSPWAERAIPEAARWASGLHVPLWLVQGIGPRPCGDGEQPVETGYLLHVAERWRSTGLDLEWDVVHDLHVGRGLSDWLNTGPATLTVAATHGRSGMKHGTLGGVANHLVRHTRGPMVLQRP